MTKLPAKNLLDGTKTPETTTGEFRLAIGNLRQFLAELFGDESLDKETARQTLGIDLTAINEKIEKKANTDTVELALKEKADKSELDDKTETIIRALTQEIAKNRTPIGTVVWFAAHQPPVGYLKADGSSVWRETYPELFAVIGTTFGGAKEDPTFSLPNLMGRFAEGSAMPGMVKEAGLPNITGGAGYFNSLVNYIWSGALYKKSEKTTQDCNSGGAMTYEIGLDASLSSAIYGKSNTVQPPALTLLPCIKAFHA